MTHYCELWCVPTIPSLQYTAVFREILEGTNFGSELTKVIGKVNLASFMPKNEGHSYK